MNRKRLLPAAVLVLAIVAGLPGCRLITDLLHMEPLRIVAHRPDTGIVDPAAVAAVQVTFSAPASRPHTEGSFSLRDGAAAVIGTFSWREGDIIEIDIPARTIRVRLSDEELEQRRRDELARGEAAFTPAGRDRQVSTALRVYAAMASSADQGAVRVLP